MASVGARNGRGAAAGWGIYEIESLEARRLLSGVLAWDAQPPVIVGTLPAPDPQAALHPLTSIPILHSDPSATAQIYLDFDGQGATDWSGQPVPITDAYTDDADPRTFSDQELANIRIIWARVAEKYSPFNIDVTTQDPGTLVDNVSMKVVIGGDGAWEPGAGGVAYLGSFTNGASNIAWVFSAQAPDNVQFVAEASAHEAGHTFGLFHQSVWDAKLLNIIQQYNDNNASKFRAPIMGNSYTARRGLWWRGTDSELPAPSLQDDLSIISDNNNGFGYKTDDFGDTFAAATPMTAVSPTDLTAAGIITSTTDVDMLSFVTGSGTVTFNANPAPFGPMLDMRLEIYDSNGNLMDLDGALEGSLGANITTFLPAGQYYLAVKSMGNQGDIGQWDCTGHVILAGPQINGVVWKDANLDNIRQASEPKMAGVRVNLFRPNDVSPFETTVTNVSGQYVFPSLPPDTYTVQLVEPSGYFLALEHQGFDTTIDSDFNPTTELSDPITLVSLDDIVALDAGLQPSGITIGDTVFNDANQNGIQDLGEVGINGVTVQLIDSTGAVLQTTNTAGGRYLFEGLSANVSYRLKFVRPAGYLFSPQDQGSDDAKDSDANPSDGATAAVILALHEQRTNVDAGMFRPVITFDSSTLNISVPEGNSGTSQAIFTVNLSAASDVNVDVNYDTSDASAVSGTDYVSAFGTITFLPGETTHQIAVDIIGDQIVEPDKLFYLTLSAPGTAQDAGIVGTTAIATCTILNDDGPGVSVADVAVVEHATTTIAYFPVTLEVPSSKPVTVSYATNDGTGVAGVDYQAASGTLTFNPGTTTILVPIQVLTNVDANTARTFFVNLLTSQNATLNKSQGQGTIADLQSFSVPFGGAVKARYIDNSGNRVIIEMKGPGIGHVLFLGSQQQDGVAITVDGTTEQSQLSISTQGGQTSFVSITANTPIGSIIGKSANLTGNLNATGGVRQLQLNFVASGNTITIGGGPSSSITSLTATFGRVIDLSITSAVAIKQLRMQSNNDSDHLANTISAPSIANLTSLGDFASNISVTGLLDSMSVAGTLKNSVIRAGSINSITARAIHGSTIFAGISNTTTTLPVLPGQFVTPASFIKGVFVRSKDAGSFSNSIIAAPTIGDLLLGNVNSSNFGNPLGVSAITIKSARGKVASTPFSLTLLDSPGVAYSKDDFLIRVV